MKGVFVLVGFGLLVGVIAWITKRKIEEPDLTARYRAAWNITNDEIRNGDEAA